MIEMEFEGLDELIKEFEELATEVEMENIDKKVLKECAELAHKEVKKNIWVSDNHSLSGAQHKGSNRNTPSGHARDNVPISNVKKKKDSFYITVGWDKGNNGEYFYAKFKEWGTSKMPPDHAFGGVNKKLFEKYEAIAIKYYEKELEKRLN